MVTRLFRIKPQVISWVDPFLIDISPARLSISIPDMNVPSYGAGPMCLL